MNFKKILFFIFTFLSVVILSSFFVKGDKGNPLYFQTEHDTKVGGPYESSGNTSRYALTEAIVENKTFFLNKDQANFASPDSVEKNGKFMSLYPPGISFFSLPFYIFGKTIGFPQLITYLPTTFLAILNFYLIYGIATKLGTNKYAGLISGFIYLFATNALPYSFTLTQHQASVTLILLAFLNIFGKRTFIKNILLGAILGAGVLVDVPNIFLLTPIMLYSFFKNITLGEHGKEIIIKFKLSLLGIILGLTPFLIIFGLYNHELSGSYFRIIQLGGGKRIELATADRTQIAPQETSGSTSKKIDLPFNPRRQLSGTYILLISNQRGLFYYSPILLLGIIGFFVGYKSGDEKIKKLIILSSTVVAMNIILYSMFHDPWGGWAFGPRYLIPSAAILSVAIGLAIERFKRNLLFILVFIVLFAYSLGVNTIGAMTTTQVPPKVEAVNLPNPIPYTYEYNLQLIDKNFTSSLAYSLFLTERISPKTFVIIFYLTALTLGILIYVAAFLKRTKSTQND